MFGIAPYSSAYIQPEQYAQQYQQHNPPQAAKPTSTFHWYRQLRELEQRQPETMLQSAVTGLRQNTESMALSALLGFVSAEYGLDVKKVPLDMVGAAVLYALSIGKAGDPNGFAGDLRALSQTCSNIWAFRKTEAWREAQKRGVDSSMNIHTSEKPDPILDAGKKAGL